MSGDYYYQPYSSNCPELDPNAVNELFENVVYGEGLDVVDGAQQRRLEAERRRLEMERRSQENALKRAQDEKDRQFFNTLMMSGPDRPVSKSDLQSVPTKTPSDQPAKIQILFTAADRSKIPRKTRQQWLDKFCSACEVAFPGTLTTLESSLILSLEQSVYQTTKTATAYIGAWMNKIHAMKSAPSLNEFVSPTIKNGFSVVEDSDEVKESEPLPLQASTLSPEEENAQDKDDVNNVELLPSSSPTSSSNPGKASLLGKELPFSLFGSDDEDDLIVGEFSSPADQQNEGLAAEVDLPSLQQQSSECNHQSESSRKSVVDGNVEKESIQKDVNVVVASDISCETTKQSEDLVKYEELQQKSDRKSNKAGNEGGFEHQPVESNTNVVKCQEPSQHEDKTKKRSQRDGTPEHSSLEKKQKRFDPECKTFIRDVVAAHLRLRFGKELSGKVVVAIQSRVVEKILSDPKWTLERLRKHKRDIDDLAERYAIRIRREKKSSIK